MLSENGEVIKNRHDRAPDHSTVSIQNAGQTLPCGCSLKNDMKTISEDANLFENGLEWTGP